MKNSRKVSAFLVLILLSASLPLLAQTETTTTTSTVSAPVATPPVVATESVTTTKTFVKTRTLYLRNSYSGSIKTGHQVFVRPNGRIYDDEGTYVGHLTDLDGSDISVIPSDHRYKIRNAKGTIIASTKLTSAYDGDRPITIALQDMNGKVIAETVQTTSTTSAPVAPVPVQSSTTTTTTQSNPARLTVP